MKDPSGQQASQLTDSCALVPGGHNGLCEQSRPYAAVGIAAQSNKTIFKNFNFFHIILDYLLQLRDLAVFFLDLLVELSYFQFH